MAKKKDEDPSSPVRKVDPYVSGGAYKGGGEGDGGQGGEDDDDGSGCMVVAAPVVVGIGLVGVLLRFALSGRKR
jgi:hypothetical protein